MGAVNAETLELVVREQLAERDRRRRARLWDQAEYAAADSAAVAAILAAAGCEPPGAAVKAIRRGRRNAAVNQAAAFGDGAA